MYTCIVRQQIHSGKIKYALTYIINHLQVLLASATIVRVLYKTTDRI